MGFKTRQPQRVAMPPPSAVSPAPSPPQTKQYSCFICNHKSPERGLPLLTCRTTFSNICLGEKLQEILGDHLTVLVSPRDSVCWKCATFINRVDRYEHKRDILKEHITDSVMDKYRHQAPIPSEVFQITDDNNEKGETEMPMVIDKVEVNTEKGSGKKLGSGGIARRRGRPPSSTPKMKVRGERHLCRFCGYSYTTEPALLTHMLQKHPPKFLCSICDSPFSNKTRYNTHMELHKTGGITKAPFKCRQCGFSSEQPQVEFIHVCDTVRVLKCCICKKEKYVPKEMVVHNDFKCDHCHKHPPCASNLTKTNIKEELAKQVEEKVISKSISEPPPVVYVQKEVVKGDFVVNNDVLLSQEQPPLSQPKELPEVPKPTSILKCPNCEEEFELANVSSHRCFVENHVVEYLQAYNPDERSPAYLTTGIIEIVQDKNDSSVSHTCKCKTCNEEFTSTNLLRRHWQTTGHAWEVDTDFVEFNNITDKVNNTQTTFKVLKQKFDMKANITPAEGVEGNYEENDSVKNMIIRVTRVPKCSKCDVVFPNETTLRQHENNGCLKCITCSVTFIDRKLLRKHYLCTGHSSKLVAKAEEEKEAPVPPPNSGSLKCRKCGKAFTSVKLWVRHRLKHRVKCLLCGARFISGKSLALHNGRFHAATSCKICGKSFRKLQALLHHQGIHPQGRQYSCKDCTVVVSSRLALWVHCRVHHALYTCSHCGRDYSSTARLAVHRWRVHRRRSLKPYRCPLCPRATFFSVPGTMRRHMTRIHNTPELSNLRPQLTTDEQLFRAADNLLAPLLLNEPSIVDSQEVEPLLPTQPLNEVVIETKQILGELLQ